MSAIGTRSRANSQSLNTATPPFLKTSSRKNSSISSSEKSKRKMKPELAESETQIVFEDQEINPEDVSPATWLTMFNTLNTTLAGLQNDIKELHLLKGTVETYFIQWKETVDQNLQDSDNKADNHDFQLKLLKNMVINQDEKIKFLESKVTAAYEREIKPNMIIHGILEIAEEDRDKLLTLVKDFFKDTMEIQQTIEVTDVYCLGEGKEQSIMIKLKFLADKSLFYEHVSTLKGKENAKKKLYFIQDDLSDTQQEEKNQYRKLVKENKEHDEEDQLEVKIKKAR